MADLLDRAAFDARTFVRHLRSTASMIAAPFDGGVVSQVLTAFEEDLSRCVVQLKTTSDPHDGLYFRFFASQPDDLVGRADVLGVRRFRPYHLDELQAEVAATCPGATQAG